ncbi:MAG: Gfo/Idh/MocA family oxidoreductase [Chloroflexota bacterium]
MSDKRVRVGVIGAGGFAEQAHIPGLQAHPRAEVVALCARNRERAEAMARRFGVPDVHTDYHEVLARDDIDAITVATPDAMHLPVTLDALAAGKHVFCEKPLAMNADEGRRMAAAADRAALVTMVAFTFRYMRALPELRRLLREGVIGSPFHVTLQVYWGNVISPGSALTWRDQAEYSAAGMWGDGGSHLFDALSYAVAPAQEVCAQMMVVKREDGSAQPDSVDIATALARLRLLRPVGGATEPREAAPAFAQQEPGVVHAVLTSSRVSRPRGPVHEMEVVGTRGALGIPLNRGQQEYLHILRPGSNGWEELPLPDDARTDRPLAVPRMMGAFADAVLRGARNPEQDPGFGDGLHAQLAMEAGLRSTGTGCWERV